MDKIIINNTTESDWDEWYCEWYRCPSCNEMDLMEEFNFCPHCGVPIKWQLNNE